MTALGRMRTFGHGRDRVCTRGAGGSGVGLFFPLNPLNGGPGR
jgi:hypothetical protein